MAKNKIICIGSALIDESFYCRKEPIIGTSNPAAFSRTAGGVARNIAQHLSQLGNEVELISHFGNDADGKWLTEQCESTGISLAHSVMNDQPTGRYVAILSPAGELFTGAAVTHFETEISKSYLEGNGALLETASIVVLDCNLNEECLVWILEFCRTRSIPCVIEPVSIAKSERLRNKNLEHVLLLTPNQEELNSICERPAKENAIPSAELLIRNGVQYVWVRKGKEGSDFFSASPVLHLPAPEVHVSDTTGAGDAALAGWIHAWLKNKPVDECLIYGHAMAEIIIQTQGANTYKLNAELLERTAANQKAR